MSRKVCFGTVILTLILSVSCAVPTSNLLEPANTQAGEVDFELAGPGGAALMVPVYVNGQGPFNFVLDTGATITCVDEELATKLQLPEKRGPVGIGATIGATGAMRLVQIDSLQVGTAKASSLIACVLDLKNMKELGLEVNGLVGLNFLKSYHVAIDFQRQVVQLRSPSEQESD
ncbi:MAG TPA: retropepsin-like aspartic protease [Pyrinomonadaceae bacterium]|nr:retropepsin-like aspartic protease [Pyrinomonadaceae bacterium]